MALFGLSVAGLLGFVYWSTAGVISHQVDETIQAEITGLAEHYRQRGLSGLKQIIRERSRLPGERGIYLLANNRFRPVVGNLSEWPDVGRGEPSWIDFLIEASGTANEPQVARARTFQLDGNYHLLVGRDTTERGQFRSLIIEALLGALGLTALLGVAGGLLMSRMLLHRIEAINRGSRAILDGDLSQRMPVTSSDDEFDHLAANLNAMLDQIERLMAGMRNVADNIAHDLRTPINRLRSRLEVTLLNERDATTYRQVLEETIEEADTILVTFNALLGIALAESGALRDRFEPVDLVTIARDAAEMYEPLADERNIELTTWLADSATVCGNRHLLVQAVTNLLDNAIKYVPQRGRVLLEVNLVDGASEIVVADNGPGIPAEWREQSLERHVRLEASRQTPGSGLGLSLVSAVARLHGARLSLEDNAPGLRVRMRFSTPHVRGRASQAA